jgi:hypothetical protein
MEGARVIKQMSSGDETGFVSSLDDICFITRAPSNTS